MCQEPRKPSKRTKLNFGTLNVQGCKEEHKRKTLAKEALAFNLDILGRSETHMPGQGLEDIQTSKCCKQTNTTSYRNYLLFHTGSDNNKFHGVGLLINKDLNQNFERISDRICSAKIKLAKRNLIVISVYALTLQISEQNPDLREEFYEKLDRAISRVGRRNMVVVVGDFNAKTGSGWREFSKNMGKYGKGHINSIGRFPLELLSKHDFVLSNTLFKHKLAHRTTWTAPEKLNNHNSQDGSVRRNPYRNQIDYIITKSKQ